MNLPPAATPLAPERPPPPDGPARPSRRAGRSLHARMLAAFFAVSLLPLAALIAAHVRTTRQALLDAADNSLGAAASRTAVSLDGFIGASLDVVGTQARLEILRDYLELPEAQRADPPVRARMLAELDSFNRRDPVFIESCAILDLRGRNLLDTDERAGRGLDESDRDYFKMALEDDVPSVSAVELSAEDGRAHLYFSSPVHGANGAAIGVLRVRYGAEVLQQRIEVTSGLAGPESFALLVDEGRLVLGHSLAGRGSAKPELYSYLQPLDAGELARLRGERRALATTASGTGTPVLLASIEQAALLASASRNEMPSKPDVAAALKLSAAGRPRFSVEMGVNAPVKQDATVTLMATRPWAIVVLQPEAIVLAPVEEGTRQALLLVLAIAGLVAVAAVALTRSLTRPLERLTVMAGQMAMGDFDARADVDQGGEIGTLAAAFDRMAERIRSLIADLGARNRELVVAHEELEQRVAQRTAELSEANSRLRDEVAERRRAEQALAALNHRLEATVAERTADLEQKLELIGKQQRQLLEMSAPVIQLWEGVLVLPLVGTIDGPRAEQILRNVLHSIAQNGSRHLLIDVTGTFLVDDTVVEYLIRTVRAARLVGTTCFLVGIAPKVAQALAQSGLDLKGVRTVGSLQQGLATARREIDARRG
ncbi:MAG TPA: HAMP domain-containing protein [Polyangiaceae bacterium]|nr:HAMP domain-containing protein [Polyangiaceae bacterium]